MQSLLNEEQHIWKQLVKYHFTKENLKWASNVITEQQIQFDSKTCDVDWEQLFHLLRKYVTEISNYLDNFISDHFCSFRKFGLKEEYTDCLFLCRYCRCLFWKVICFFSFSYQIKHIQTFVSHIFSKPKLKKIAKLKKIIVKH